MIIKKVKIFLLFSLTTFTPVFYFTGPNTNFQIGTVFGGKVKTLLKLKKERYPIEFVVNFSNSGINRKELSRYLKNTPTIFIPAINPEYIYKAGYRNKIPLDYPEVEELLFKPLSDIIKNIIPLGLFKETLRDKSSYNSSNIIHRLKEKIIRLKYSFLVK